ncbi:protein kinase domain-containing protein [Actinoplanes sp. CA-030573]|uniref:serine/threonine-protein kinase n=1 Tax=Actinoplanes sp. CA-030573 TaxID=3239898 RepID=UPI003D8B28F4
MEVDLGAARPGLLLGGRYRLIEPAGKGGMAIVWRAWDIVLARTVAVKMLAPHARDAESLTLIRHEARAAASLSHPNVAQVHDYGECIVDGEPVPYVVFEFVNGPTLLRRLRTGEVTSRFGLRVCAEVAAALAAAHAAGLVHRDIKPANVMLAPTGAKVVDFGIAAAATAHEATAPDGSVLGTPTYIAPERLLGQLVTPASDVYALGVLLYRLLAGQTPWEGESPDRVLANHLRAEPPPLVPRDPVPGHVVDLCLRCLRKDPADRPSAREITRLLAHAAGLEIVEDAPQPSATGGPAPAEPSMVIRPPRRPHRTALVLAAALLVLGGLATAGWLATRGGAGGPTIAGGPTAPGAPPTGEGRTDPGARGTTAGIRPAATTGTLPPGQTALPGGAVVPTAPGTPGATGPAGPAGGGAVPPTPGVTPTPVPTATTPPVTATTEAPPPATERTLTSPGGTVVATCPAASTARILSWTPARSYHVESTDAGPGAAPSVTFAHGKDTVTMTVTCTAGEPSADIT